MSDVIVLLTPVGRMVEGSMYKPNTKDLKGNPLTTKTGANAGQPRVDYYFAIAIAKGAEQHWAQTPWGQIIYNEGVRGFPGGQHQQLNFAWKITDGDSQTPNTRNVMPCSKEGFPGHWVLRFSSGFPPSIVNSDGSQKLIEPDAVKNGYFIQVSGTVAANNNVTNPGVYLNHNMVALSGYGQEIIVGPDPASVGFGQGPLPAGASPTPVGGQFNPAVPGQPVVAPVAATQPVTPGMQPMPPGQPVVAPVAATQPPQPVQPGMQPGVQPGMQPMPPGQPVVTPVAATQPVAPYMPILNPVVPQ